MANNVKGIYRFINKKSGEVFEGTRDEYAKHLGIKERSLDSRIRQGYVTKEKIGENEMNKQEAIEEIKNLEGLTILDNDAEKCKDNKDLSWYNKEIKRIAKDIARISKEIANNLALELREIESKDNIVSPNHYVSKSGIEVFDVQEAFINESKGMSANYWCNIVKYILRFQRKNDLEDLKKAKYYLEKLVDEESNNE